MMAIKQGGAVVDSFAVAVRLAGMLLLHDSQISLEEIEALPFVHSRLEAQAVARKLVRSFAGQYALKIDPNESHSEMRILLGLRDASAESRHPDTAINPSLVPSQENRSGNIDSAGIQRT